MSGQAEVRWSRPAPRVELAPDLNVIIEAIGFLIQEAVRRSFVLTQYEIVKALFFADRSSLNLLGRPITFDNYVAMKHGPVPSLSYDLLKMHEPTLRAYGIDSLPWKRQPADYKGKGAFRFFDPSYADGDLLSPSAKSTLKDALSIISGLTFWQIRELTHNDPAYKEAWAFVQDENSSNPMSLGLLFDTPDYAAADEIAFKSHQAAKHQADDDEFAIPTDIDTDSGH